MIRQSQQAWRLPPAMPAAPHLDLPMSTAPSATAAMACPSRWRILGESPSAWQRTPAPRSSAPYAQADRSPTTASGTASSSRGLGGPAQPGIHAATVVTTSRGTRRDHQLRRGRTVPAQSPSGRTRSPTTLRVQRGVCCGRRCVDGRPRRPRRHRQRQRRCHCARSPDRHVGARIAIHLAYELRRRGGGIGVAALCGGGGQGDALVIKVDGRS